MENAIVAVENNNLSVSKQWRTATDVAGAVRDFALRRVVTIGGKKYPPVEVWQAIANAFGCVASAKDVERSLPTKEGDVAGWKATATVRRMSDGNEIAFGEGFVGDDEKTWSSRPVYARRAMTQTRAISRACRAAFAFVIPLIDADLQTTPAEEMEGVTIDRQAPVIPMAKPKANDALKARLTQTLERSVPMDKIETVEVMPPEPPPPDEEEFSQMVEQEAAQNDAPPPDATYTKMKDGVTWGVKVIGEVAPGQTVIARNKAGKTKTEIIERVVWSGPDKYNGGAIISLCTTEK